MGAEYDWDEVFAIAREMRGQEPDAKAKRRMYAREYYQRTREEQLARQRAYREEHREEVSGTATPV